MLAPVAIQPTEDRGNPKKYGLADNGGEILCVLKDNQPQSYP